jgi:hypothetical protein
LLVCGACIAPHANGAWMSRRPPVRSRVGAALAPRWRRGRRFGSDRVRRAVGASHQG